MYTEKQLLNGLRNKELDAYEELFFKYHGRLVLFARKFTGNLEFAQDIVQDAFMALWEKADGLTINTSPKAYLFQAVRNRSLNLNRHLNVKQAVQNEMVSKITEVEQNIYSNFDDPFYSLLELEMKQKIEMVIESMPEKCQLVFKMSRREQKKNKEIANEMGISVKMVEKYMSTALRILRSKLSDYMAILLLILLKNL